MKLDRLDITIYLMEEKMFAEDSSGGVDSAFKPDEAGEQLETAGPADDKTAVAVLEARYREIWGEDVVARITKFFGSINKAVTTMYNYTLDAENLEIVNKILMDLESEKAEQNENDSPEVKTAKAIKRQGVLEALRKKYGNASYGKSDREPVPPQRTHYTGNDIVEAAELRLKGK